MAYKTREWRNSMRVTVDYNNMTDAVRANLLEYRGYRTQVLEFVDLSHTPKNVLLRAVRRPVTPAKTREMYRREVEKAMAQFHVEPTLNRLLVEEE